MKPTAVDLRYKPWNDVFRKGDHFICMSCRKMSVHKGNHGKCADPECKSNANTKNDDKRDGFQLVEQNPWRGYVTETMHRRPCKFWPTC